MRGLNRIAVSGLLLFPLAGAIAKPAPSPADDRDSVVIVYKNGHRQSLAAAEIARVELKAPATIVYKDGHREKISSEIDRIEFGSPEVGMTPGRGHFVGKWEVGQGGNAGNFFITLDEDGSARKSIGASHGTWTVVDEGGSHQLGLMAGTTPSGKSVQRTEKRAYEPGKSFDEEPSNA